MSVQCEPSSFRDPAGFIFRRDGTVFRQINRVYGPTWQRLKDSGFYDKLAESRHVVAVEEVALDHAADERAAFVLRPEQVGLITYPYEWSFGRLRDAALLTLQIQRQAIQAGFSLKDASAYNVQTLNGRPVLIDSLSFEVREEGKPWIAYGQFCRHFLAPLALMAYGGLEFGKVQASFIDGIDLSWASRLLPWGTRLKPGLLTHLHVHGRSAGKEGKGELSSLKVSDIGALGLLHSLQKTIEGLPAPGDPSRWTDYYNANSYVDAAFKSKERVVGELLKSARGKTVWDLGANLGYFSEIAHAAGAKVTAWDSDPATVGQCYERWKSEGTPIEALIQDFANPSPGIGWANRERASFAERGPCDIALALALVHHLRIGNNVPFLDIVRWLAHICRECIIEFVPKSDSQVQRLLRARADVFEDYTEEAFVSAFSDRFDLIARCPLESTDRVIFHFRRT